MEESVSNKVIGKVSESQQEKSVSVKKLRKLFEAGKISVHQLLDEDIVVNKNLHDIQSLKSKDIRNFFCAAQQNNSNKKRSDLSLTTSHAIKRAQSVTNQPRHTSSKVCHTIKRRSSFKGVLTRSARRRETSIQRENINKPEQLFFDSDSSVFSDDFHTPDLTPNTSFDMGGAEQNNSQQQQHEDQMLQIIAANMKHVESPIAQKKSNGQVYKNKRPRNEEDNSDTDTNDSRMSQQTMDSKEIPEDDPQALSYSTVIQMFQELKKEMKDEVRAEIASIKTGSNTESIQQHTELVSTVDQNSAEIDKLKCEVAMYKHRTTILTDVCERFQTEMQDMQTRLDNIELNNCKKMLIITGLYTLSQKKNEIINEVTNFIDVNLGMQINIEDMFTLGYNEPRPIVISLQSVYEKKLILQNKAALKDQGQTRVFINEYVPSNTQERRRKEKEIIDVARQMGVERGTETAIAYHKGKLTIDGHYYRPKVVPPTPKELINMNIDDLNRVQKMSLQKGQEFTQDGSKFLVYKFENAESHQQIRDLYKKMKIIEPTARHIPCAYWLPGEDKHYTQASHDDGEAGAGRILLQNLLQYGRQGTVVFAVRRYGGVKIGTDRFDLYSKSVIQALGGDPDKHTQRAYNARKLQFQKSQSQQQHQLPADVTHPMPKIPSPNQPNTTRKPFYQRAPQRFNHRYMNRRPGRVASHYGIQQGRYTPRGGNIRNPRVSTQGSRGAYSDQQTQEKTIGFFLLQSN